MPARKYTPEEKVAARIRELEKQREYNRKRRSNPELLAKERAQQSKARRSWSPERRARANAVSRASYARKSETQREYTAKYMREYTLKTKYGLTSDEWLAIFEAQGRKCACCNSAEPGSKLGWATDHSHTEPYQVRGILCHKCNLDLGRLGDSYDEVLVRTNQFLNYLDGYRG